jgi:hypothetical protein
MSAAAPAAPGAPITGPIASAPSESTRLARLSHRQYDNSLKDLLRLTSSPGLAAALVTEPLRGNFDNNGQFLQVSPGLWVDYQRAAESLAESVARDAKKLAAILPANLPADPAARARGFIEGFGQRAYRRPLTPAEVDAHLALFNQGQKLVGTMDPFAAGVEVVLTLMLQSPHFLYRTELSGTAGAGGKVALSDHEIASKLSYALTNTMPDDLLFAAAAGKRLSTREGLLAEATRLLGSSAAQKTIEDFHAQLLNMAKYDQISKDEKKFPEYKAGIGGLMRQETLAFVMDAVKTDKGLTWLLTSSRTYVNSRLALVYGLSAPTGMPDNVFQWVDLDPTKRAGLLTQLGFLASYADGSQPQTILRGAFINHDILCQELPPPPDAFTLPPPMGQTNRQRIETATGAAACAGCHVGLINPPGFGLEAYDALGRYRTMDGTMPVNAKATFAFDGEPKAFDGGVELSKLVAGSRQAHDCYAQNWMEYTYGRLVSHDRPADAALRGELGRRSKGGASVKALLLDLIATDAFTTRLP